VVLLDVRRVYTVADFYVVATAESSPQLQALQDNLDLKLKEDYGLNPLRRDGRGSSAWSVLDYGGLVVHLMSPAALEFYGL
jgi:ribosome-associated protein